MSSVASIFSQKARESLGLATVTKDSDLINMGAKLAELERDVTTLKRVLETTNRVFNQQLVSGRAQMVNVMNDLYAKVVPSTAVSRESFGQFNDAHTVLDSELPKKFEPAFEKAVLEPITAWQKTLDELKAELKTTQDRRVIFDHYREKVDAMKDSKRKLLQRGKIVDKATDEKLARNEGKLASSESEYFALRDQTVGRLLFTFREASSHLESVLLRVMQFEAQSFAETATAVTRYGSFIPQLLQHVKDKAFAATHSGALEACVAHARESREGGHPLPMDSINAAVEAAFKVVGPGGGPIPASPASSAAAAPASSAPVTAAPSAAAAAVVPPAASSSSFEVGRSKATVAAAPAAASRAWDDTVFASDSGASGSSISTSSKTAGFAAAASQPAASAPVSAAAFLPPPSNPFGAPAAAASATNPFAAAPAAAPVPADPAAPSFDDFGSAFGGQQPAAASTKPPPPPRASIAAAAPLAASSGNPFGGGGGGGLGAPPAAGVRRTPQQHQHQAAVPAAAADPFAAPAVASQSLPPPPPVAPTNPFGGWDSSTPASAPAAAAPAASTAPPVPPRRGAATAATTTVPAAPAGLPPPPPPPPPPPSFDPNDPFGGL